MAGKTKTQKPSGNPYRMPKPPPIKQQPIEKVPVPKRRKP